MAGESARELLDQAVRAANQGKFEQAVELAGKAIDLDPKAADPYQFRGLVHFRAGKIKESITDFDKFIELNPKAKISHWQRGISYYYAGRYDEGRKQFEGYQEFDSADVENAVWRFMCMAKKDSLAAARKDILKVGNDRRLVMKEVYEMFAGRLKPADVLKVAEAALKDDPKNTDPPFYAHLYVGIYFDLEGDRKQALTHLERAVNDYRIRHYMWDVARVHRDLLKK